MNAQKVCFIESDDIPAELQTIADKGSSKLKSFCRLLTYYFKSLPNLSTTSAPEGWKQSIRGKATKFAVQNEELYCNKKQKEEIHCDYCTKSIDAVVLPSNWVVV